MCSTHLKTAIKQLLENPPADPATATRLAQPAALSGSAIVLDRSIATGTVLMVDAGTAVEFCQLTAAATPGTSVAIAPPLQKNHPANTPVRQLTATEAIGRLQTAASAESQEIDVTGEATAVEAAQRQEQLFISPGEILQLVDLVQPLAVQVTAVTERTSAIQGVPEAFFAIGGWVTDNTGSRNPLLGARVTLRELQLQASTDAGGRFTFVTEPASAGAASLTLSTTQGVEASSILRLPGNRYATVTSVQGKRVFLEG